MEAMQWLALGIFAVTILAVVTNVIDSTLAALIGVAVILFLAVYPQFILERSETTVTAQDTAPVTAKAAALQPKTVTKVKPKVVSHRKPKATG